MTLDTPFPFTALHGQPLLQSALLLATVDPLIGGVLVEGPRGTAKSTAARALAALLPGGRFVNLPLSASEEQLVGSLDLEAVLQGGEVRFRPGLLARAHEGVLYVDEVNLLADGLVDLLLDVCASGVNRIERDGISHAHAARLTLVGTMNPEEGELRPQLLDRFGLFVRLDNVLPPAERQAIVRARLAFDADPAAFAARHAPAQQALAARIASARGPAADRIQRRRPRAGRRAVPRRRGGRGARGPGDAARRARPCGARRPRGDRRRRHRRGRRTGARPPPPCRSGGGAGVAHAAAPAFGLQRTAA